MIKWFWISIIIFIAGLKQEIGERKWISLFIIVYLFFMIKTPNISYQIFSGLMAIFLGFTLIMDNINKPKRQENTKRKNEVLTKNNFHIDDEIEICRSSIKEKLFFVIDKTTKQFAIFKIENNNGLEDYNIWCFNFSEILDYELVENSDSKFALNGLTSVGGALCFGLTGALVGMALGGVKEKKINRNITVNIKLDRKDYPYLSLCLLSGGGIFGDSNSVYSCAKERAQKLIDMIEYIKANN